MPLMLYDQQQYQFCTSKLINELNDNIIIMSNNFKLVTKFTFWVQQIDTVKAQLYSSNLREVATFSQIREFWQFFQFLKHTNDLPNCDMYMFKEGVKPLWEDVNNIGGGCYKIKIQKKKSNKLWESTVLSMLSPKNKNIDITNGIRIKIRQNFDEIELWMNSGATQKDKLENIKQFLKQNTQITDDRVFNYLPFSKK